MAVVNPEQMVCVMGVVVTAGVGFTVTTTFEGSGAEFSYSQSTVLMGLAECFLQLVQSEQAISTFGA